MTNESGPPEDAFASRARPTTEDRQDANHLRASIEKAHAKWRRTPTPEQENALKQLAAGEGEPLALSKILRPAPHLLESWPLPDTELVRAVQRLVQLSNAEAFALVEVRRVPVDKAALVGHPELAAAIDAMPKFHLTFIVSEWGRPYSIDRIGKLFCRWATAAGLPRRCRLHGLKKGGMRRLAESGGTTHELMAISGHRTLSSLTAA